jgi:RNase P protein component
VTEADPSAVPAPVMSVPVTRFGFTVGKRNARLSVDRNLVRRVLREAARHAAPALDQAAGPDQLDIVLRLKSTLPPKGSDARARLRADLRNEADSLLAQLTHRLAARHATGTTGADNPAGRA